MSALVITLVIMMGVGMLTVPTGIITTGFAIELQRRRDVDAAELASSGSVCPTCGRGPDPTP